MRRFLYQGTPEPELHNLQIFVWPENAQEHFSGICCFLNVLSIQEISEGYKDILDAVESFLSLSQSEFTTLIN